MRAALLLLIGVSLPSPTAAQTTLFLEPELGFRSTGGDLSDVVKAGPMLGGTVGYFIDPRIALIGRLDLSIHEPAGASSVLEGAAIFLMSAGGRFYPLGSDALQPAQPFFGLSLGLAGFGWSYDPEYVALERFFGNDLPDSDGLSSWIASLDGGVHFRLNESISLGGAARVNVHLWDSTTAEGYDVNLSGSSFQIGAQMGIHF